MKDPVCPLCDAEVPVTAEQDGEATYCPYCGMTLRVRIKGEAWEAEEDY